MATITCLACGGTYASHFPRCIACNTPQPEYDGPAAAPVAAARPMPPPPPAARPAAPPKPECPCCGEAPGRGSIRMEKREYQGMNLRMTRKYEVRWVDIPGVCSGCMRALELRRYAADVLCNVPFVVLFVLLVSTGSKFVVVLLITYALILFKWSWGLSYVWADLLLYGWNLGSSLARFEPPGDSGTLRFPSGWGHAILRFGLLPGLAAGLLLLAGVFGFFVKRTDDGKGGAPAVSVAAVEKIKDPVERAKVFLSAARDLAVPVDSGTEMMLSQPMGVQDLALFIAYPKPEQLPAGSSYQLMTGPQLLAAMLRVRGAEGDLLVLDGTKALSITRGQADQVAAALPPAGPIAGGVLRKP